MLISVAFAGSDMSAPPREVVSQFSTVRLLNAGMRGGVWRSGIAITLDADWKTYWRVPGDSGVPPQFDWSASKNAADIGVSMPVPARFADQNGEGIGYKMAVVFPVDVKPSDPSRPVDLSLHMFYAVCNNICVPVQAHLALRLQDSGVSVADRFTLDVAGAAVPTLPGSGEITVKSVDAGEAQGQPELRIELAGDLDPSKVDIFVEGIDKAYFRAPELIKRAPAGSLWRLKADGVSNANELRGKIVRVTVAFGQTGLVQDVPVQ